MDETIVVGIGNPLRGDDGIGWAVVDRLLTEPFEGITAVHTHQLLPELIDRFHEAAQIIFVDASMVGKLGNVTVTAVSPATDGTTASHHLHPGVLLALGVKLYGRMPPAHLVTITGHNFGYREELSTLVEQAIRVAISQIKQLAGVPTSL
ncbi:hydrogenase maturation protease [Candidatus Leptofilum sp.]|uniref:hydrogenase maturation protease n=1 Tax=Candidatus Leptofilum sp. TaxID=3241576 RepID=UPI003B5A9586